MDATMLLVRVVHIFAGSASNILDHHSIAMDIWKLHMDRTFDTANKTCIQLVRKYGTWSEFYGIYA